MRQEVVFEISSRAEQMCREPVQVPCGAERLHISVDLPEEFRYMSFIIAEDPDGEIRLQKQLAFGDQELGIGSCAKDTSTGGVPGVIQPGIWQIGLGIFTEYLDQRLGDGQGRIRVTVSDEDRPVSDPISGTVWVEGGLTISPEKYGWNRVCDSRARWYKGDFHTHTRLSDGKETLKNAMKKAADMQMDFYVPTEHNLMHTGWCGTSLCILPGIEVTTDKGHMNLFGITEMPKRILDIVAHNGEDIVDGYMEDTIREAREKGWLTSINHPFLTIWKWRYGDTRLDDIDCVELINDPTYTDAPDANEKTLQFLDALWEDGHKICGVGGSDSHNLIWERYEGADLPSVPGDPATWVFCRELTPRHLMEAVRQRHVCVTRFCGIEPRILAAGREILPGDEIPEEAESLSLCLKLSGLEETPIVYVVVSGASRELEVRRQQDETGAAYYEARGEVELTEENWQWIRLEARDRRGRFLAWTNPVFRGSKMPVCRTFGEIRKKLEEEKA